MYQNKETRTRKLICKYHRQNGGHFASASACWYTVYPKKYAHGFVVLCFVVVMQSFIMNSHQVIIHIHQGCFAGTGAIVRLPQCQWSKPDGYEKISQCIITTKHSKAKTVCIFLGIYYTTYISLNINDKAMMMNTIVVLYFLSEYGHFIATNSPTWFSDDDYASP